MTNEHLDDEAISAHLDGEATPAEAAHVDGCDVCAARLAELRAAASAIGSPVALDFLDRDAAVVAALDTLPPKVVPLAPRRRRFQGGIPAWVGVAAAVLVLLALVPLLGQVGTSDDGDDTAAGTGGATDEAAEEGGTFDADTEMRVSAPVVDGGDVGAVDEQAVRRLVEEAVVAPQPTAEAEAEDDAAESGPAADQVPAPCEDRARTEFPDLGALRYRALGTVAGEAQSILAFELTAEAPRLRVLAYDVAECGITFVLELATS